MKRLLALLLAVLMVLPLTACGMTADDLDTAIDILDAVIDELDEADTEGGNAADVPDVPDIPDAPEITDTPAEDPETPPDDTEDEPALDERGTYDSKDDVALYIVTYGHLPDNYITKDEARDLGWEGGSVEDHAPGMCIGGDRFGNFEGLLPNKDGRYYTECDIDTLGKDSRGPKRIVFSNDGLVYYTPDHYETFELLYGEE